MANSTLVISSQIKKRNTTSSTESKNEKSDGSSFVITDDFDEDDYNRPDVPDSFKDNFDDSKDIQKNPQSISKKLLKAEKEQEAEATGKAFKTPLVWRNIFTMIIIHVLGFYGWYIIIRYGKWQSILWAYFIGNVSGIGVLAGAHRLWTHRSFKAHWSLRIFLMIAQTIALQNDIYEWVRDHRVHHKYSETDADPHDSRRGFFFAHVGWLLCRKHPAVKEKGSQIDMSDVWDDPIVRFQRRFYIPLVLLFWGVIPVYIPIYFWNEDVLGALAGNLFRYVNSLHHAWLVNSAAHIYGYQIYDKSIEPRENFLVAYLSLGEGYHNYHHTFPWDYSASEHGWRHCFNFATFFIDASAWLGLAWDRRIVSRETIEKRIVRTGDQKALPFFLDQKRKANSILMEMSKGMIVSSWSVWLTCILRCLFHV